MSTQTIPSQTLGEILKPKSGKLLFSFNYKIGSISRSENIRAVDLHDAEIQVRRYLRFLQKDNFAKVTISGRVKPFAIDVDECISDYNERAKREGIAEYVENPDATVKPRIMA